MFLKKLLKPEETGFFCTAVVAAAGSSTRMGTNKLLLELGGMPILAHTLCNLEACDDVHEIVIALLVGGIAYFVTGVITSKNQSGLQ